MHDEGSSVSSHGVDDLGLEGAGTVYWNLPPAALYEHAVRRGEARIAAEGPLAATTGRHTGRSPNDKFLVREPAIDGEVWWGDVNRPIEAERFERLLARVREHWAGRDVFVFDGYAGADPRYRLPVRVVTEYAWHNLFARNMFLREEDPAVLARFRPEMTVVDAATFQADPARDGTRSATFILL